MRRPSSRQPHPRCAGALDRGDPASTRSASRSVRRAILRAQHQEGLEGPRAQLALSIADRPDDARRQDTPGKVTQLCRKAVIFTPRSRTCRTLRRCASTRQWSVWRAGRSKVTTSRSRRCATAVPRRDGAACDRVLEETRIAGREEGADEIDMVIDRGAFLAGDYQRVFDEIVGGQGGLRQRAPQGDPRDRRARHATTTSAARRVLAMAAGADFIKTSTGKIQPAATMPVTLVMLEAIRDHSPATGRMVGMKPAGGIAHGQAGDPVPRRCCTRRSAPAG